MSIPKSGGQAVTLASDLGFGLDVSVDSASVYSDQDSDASTQLLRIPKAGGSTVTLASETFPYSAGIASDDAGPRRCAFPAQRSRKWRGGPPSVGR